MKAYYVTYQLGATSGAYTTKRKAARALHAAIRSANEGGDLQDIWVEDQDGNRYDLETVDNGYGLNRDKLMPDNPAER